VPAKTLPQATQNPANNFFIFNRSTLRKITEACCGARKFFALTVTTGLFPKLVILFHPAGGELSPPADSAMQEEALPEDILRFIVDRIDSLPHLELFVGRMKAVLRST